jgi:CubicO group peptidase (beta-lactamase class C family)
MKRLSKFNPTSLLLALSLFYGLVIAQASAEPMHTPTKMPMAKAESVGMSTGGLNRIDEIMQAHVDAGDIQGAVTAVARRGQVVHFSTHGDMDHEKGRAMEPDTIFIMASSTKPVIGVAVMMLMEEGLISPSDPISKFIPEFADMKVAVPIETTASKADSTGKSEGKNQGKGKGKGQGKGGIPEYRLVPVDTPITIHHLLTHTSGLMSGGLGAAVNTVGDKTADETFAAYVPKLAQVPLDFQPGTQWSYGNTGIHTLLPGIIEIVTKTSFYKFMQKRILNPLAMKDTYFDVPADRESQRMAIDGVISKKPKGGTGLFSTAEDYLHFEQMLVNGGELFGNRLLRPETVAMMSSDQTGDLFATASKRGRGMAFGYTVSVTLDPVVAANNRGKGSFGWGGAGGTVSWTDPENELVAVIMLQQPRGPVQRDFAKAVQEAIIE